MKIQDLAKILDTAAKEGEAVSQLSLKHKFSIEDAYAIQSKSMQRRYSRGEKFAGLKMGFTSKAKMEQMGINDMIWGKLTDKMLINRNSSINIKRYIHPRAEPEICFLVKKKIDKQINSIQEAKEYIAGYAAAIEVIDSRYENFKFSLEDVIADNCSSAGFVLGDWNPVEDSLKDLKITLEINEEIVHEGSSNAILDDPWESLFNCVRLSLAAGQSIPFGSYILVGAATPAVYLKPGDKVKTTVQELGEVAFSVRE